MFAAQNVKGDTVRRTGRPSDYSPPVAETICSKIAMGQSLRQIGKLDLMPSVPTVMRWLQKHEEFREQYRVSREIQADIHFDELIDLADKATPETVHVQRLRIWTRQWIMGRINARKYGEKPAETHVTTNVSANRIVFTEEERQRLQKRHLEALR